ncbi:hypothetical protein SKC41_22670 [Mycobacterium sp. 050128]|uniref:hypothetical protein n=1 Tax=Mycobacterium sp. 050128 TaxID=3096112 RepID=UPI002ED96805
MLEAYHAVEGGTIRALFGTVLLGYLSSVLLASAKGAAEVVDRIALLLGQRSGLGATQQIRKVHETRLDLSAI